MPKGKAHYRVTLADAVEAHHTAILTSGGKHGVLNVDIILSAIGRPYSGYFRSIDRKGAALLEAIIRNHGFVDGNKRTAVLLLLLLLERCEYEILELEEEEVSIELEELVVGVANQQTSFEQVQQWLKCHCIPKRHP